MYTVGIFLFSDTSLFLFLFIHISKGAHLEKIYTLSIEKKITLSQSFHEKRKNHGQQCI